MRKGTIMSYVKAILSSLLLMAHAAALLANDLPQFETAAVVLRYQGSEPLGHDDSRRLYEKAMEVLQSSNFNSADPKWPWDEAKLNVEYGRAVAGEHVVVTFVATQNVKTLGGYVPVRELIIGLNGPQYATSVHTIDGEGKLVGHAKYLGQLALDIVDLAKAIRGGTAHRTEGVKSATTDASAAIR